MRLFLPLVALLTAMLSIMPDALPAQPPPERLPVLAWLGPPAEETTPNRYRELAECGFTENFSQFPNADAVQKALDVAREAGIKQIIACPELATDPEGIARRFKGHPALAGYHLQDEPNAAEFPRLAAWVKRIQAVDPVHGCYINLFPNYANAGQLGTPTYKEHVDRFIAEVPVPYVSFDHYPVTMRGLRPEWYENLEIISAAARKAGKPFWAFVLAVAHDPYPIAKEEHMRLQAFSNLAYGAQTIQYFTYWTPKSTVWNFHQAPIADGRKTLVYNRVRKVNAEIQGLASAFLGAKVVRVGHTGTLPRGTRAYVPEAPVREVRTEGEGAVVSTLERGNRRSLVVVNRDYRAPMALTVTLDGSREVRELRKDGMLHPIERRHTATVAPGDVIVLTWSRR